MRVTIERAFGLLKNRWRLIGGTIRVRTITKATKIITAACVLHNVCINDVDEFESLFENEILETNNLIQENVNQVIEIDTVQNVEHVEEIEISNNVRDELCSVLSQANIDLSQFELQL